MNPMSENKFCHILYKFYLNPIRGFLVRITDSEFYMNKLYNILCGLCFLFGHTPMCDLFLFQRVHNFRRFSCGLLFLLMHNSIDGLALFVHIHKHLFQMLVYILSNNLLPHHHGQPIHIYGLYNFVLMDNHVMLFLMNHNLCNIDSVVNYYMSMPMCGLLYSCFYCNHNIRNPIYPSVEFRLSYVQ